jgi:hypothetical protein
MNDPDNFVAIEIAQGCGRTRRVAAARAAAALELPRSVAPQSRIVTTLLLH